MKQQAIQLDHTPVVFILRGHGCDVDRAPARRLKLLAQSANRWNDSGGEP